MNNRCCGGLLKLKQSVIRATMNKVQLITDSSYIGIMGLRLKLFVDKFKTNKSAYI